MSSTVRSCSCTDIPYAYDAFPLQYMQCGRLYKNCRHISLSRWTDKWPGRFYSSLMEILLALDFSTQRLTMKMSKNRHSDSGLGLFAARSFEKVEVLGYYYGRLFYTDFTSERQTTKTYGKGVMEVTMDSFLKWVNELP